MKVRTNVLTPPLAVPPSSVTVTVMVAVPDWLAAGVKVSVPVAFGRVYVTVGFGIRPGLSDVAVTVRVCRAPRPARP